MPFICGERHTARRKVPLCTLLHTAVFLILWDFCQCVFLPNNIGGCVLNNATCRISWVMRFTAASAMILVAPDGWKQKETLSAWHTSNGVPPGVYIRPMQAPCKQPSGPHSILFHSHKH